jgi:alanyl-tRNA synthetase
MALPTTDTIVTYPDGDVSSTGVVVHVEPVADGRSAVLLDTTACHPVDTAWPDQPADRGTLITAQGPLTIVDAVTGGVHDGDLHLGADLPVRTGTEGWTFIVAHVVDGTGPAVGEEVRVEVDRDHRAALSAGHTACHLAALALDHALAGAWTKEAPTDALGNPAFDSLAIASSRIHAFGSADTYRIGRSLRRKGFPPTALDDLAAVTDRVNGRLATWLATDSPVRVERDGRGLSARRTWVCGLPEGRTDIPCGGTHVRSLSDLRRVAVSLATRPVEGGLELTMETAVEPVSHHRVAGN